MPLSILSLSEYLAEYKNHSDIYMELHQVLVDSFKTVADELGFTEENAATNPAFRPAAALKKDIKKGSEYYIGKLDHRIVGCIAIEKNHNDPEGYFIERVAVLPGYRHLGFGKALLDRAIHEIKKRKGKTAGIGIINENTRLKNWYKDYGFEVTGTRKFDHLPFTVCFLQMHL